MKDINRMLFDDLARYRGWPCVSIYLPTHAGGFEGRAGRIRLKNLLAEAEDRLVARGIRAAEARELLASACELVNDDLFWKDQTEGLAVFISPETARPFYLPMGMRELAVVNSRFHVAPLLRLVDHPTDYYIVAISENHVRLLKANRWHACEVAVPHLPVGAAEALHYDHPSDTRQFHTAVLAPHMSKLSAYHGSGNFFEQEKTELLEYFRLIDRALRHLLRDQRVPLVFAGVDYLFPIFRQANTYAHLAEAHVHGNPDTWNDRELQERAWNCIAPQLARPIQLALVRYAELAGGGWKSDDLPVILNAAHQGHVKTLLVDTGQEVWGRWDKEQHRLRLDAERRGDSDDMLDMAIVETLNHQGEVFSVPTTVLSPGKHCAAIFRYELPH